MRSVSFSARLPRLELWSPVPGLLLALVMTVIAGGAAAQTRFLPAGDSGLWGGIRSNTHSIGERSGTEFIYSHRGRLDLGLGIGDAFNSSNKSERWVVAQFAVLVPPADQGGGLELSLTQLWDSYVHTWSSGSVSNHSRYTTAAVNAYYQARLAADVRCLLGVTGFRRMANSNWNNTDTMYGNYDGESQDAETGLAAAVEILIHEVVYAAAEVSRILNDFPESEYGLRLGVIVNFSRKDPR